MDTSTDHRCKGPFRPLVAVPLPVPSAPVSPSGAQGAVKGSVCRRRGSTRAQTDRQTGAARAGCRNLSRHPPGGQIRNHRRCGAPLQHAFRVYPGGAAAGRGSVRGGEQSGDRKSDRRAHPAEPSPNSRTSSARSPLHPDPPQPLALLSCSVCPRPPPPESASPETLLRRSG